VVFGTRPGEPDLSELARLADTIEYELLTRLSPRVRRIFETTGA
jgi:alanine racemase